MSGRRFLVSLQEVNTSEKNLMLTGVPKENLNFCEEDVYSPRREVPEMVAKVKGEIPNLSTELLETEISDDTREVTIMIAGYIAKKLRKRKVCPVCKAKLIADKTSIKYDYYLRTLSCGGLICPSPPLRDFVFHCFGTLDYISQIIHNITQNVSVRSVAEENLSDLQSNCINFTCMQQEQWGKKFTIWTVVNLFYNNKQKKVNDFVQKEQVTDFKKRQRKKEQDAQGSIYMSRVSNKNIERRCEIYLTLTIKHRNAVVLVIY